jgi:hypothetical protein
VPTVRGKWLCLFGAARQIIVKGCNACCLKKDGQVVGTIAVWRNILFDNRWKWQIHPCQSKGRQYFGKN